MANELTRITNPNILGSLYLAGTSMSATAAELNLLDGTTAGTVVASKALAVGAAKGLLGMGKIDFSGTASGGTAAAGAIIHGIGTSAAPCTWATANKNGMEYRTQSTATTGDSRGLYIRHELAGVGGSGEVMRANGMVSAAGTANAHGLHAGLGFETNGKITGQAAACRATLQIPDRALAANGTYYAGLSEIYINGDSSDISAVTMAAVHEFQVAGPGNAAAADTVPYMLSFDTTGNDGSGKLIYTHNHAPPTNAEGSILCKINGTAGYFKWYGSE